MNQTEFDIIRNRIRAERAQLDPSEARRYEQTTERIARFNCVLVGVLIGLLGSLAFFEFVMKGA
jgi:hypothetical protein